MSWKRLLLSLFIIGSLATLGSVSARADQIGFTGSDNSIGTATVTCVANTVCSLSLPTGNLGSSGNASFEVGPSNTIVGTGPYNLAFTGVSTLTMTSEVGGIDFAVSGSPWTFTFSDNAGDSITGSVNWNVFDNASAIGFNVLGGTFTTTSISAGNPFYSDFVNGGSIDLSFNPASMSTDMASCFNTGCTQTGLSVSSGEVTPAPVPEPGTLALFGTGLISLAGLVRRKLGKV